MRLLMRVVKLVLIAAVVTAIVASLLVLHVSNTVFVVTNATSQPLESVTLHLESQRKLIGTLSVGESRRARIWPRRDGGIAVSYTAAGGTRHASVGYILPWHGLFDGVQFVGIDADSVTIRQRLPSRTIIPPWREHTVPLLEGEPRGLK